MDLHFDGLRRWLTAVASAAPDTPVGALDLLDTETRRVVTAWSTRSPASPAVTQPGLLEDQVRRAPHPPAVVVNGVART
ncbi:hypothetical protein K7G98_41330, partial [Saccharothrix sp. MB29]|nr:hypothetical protein [Saccharothrix sp. MB29]